MFGNLKVGHIPVNANQVAGAASYGYIIPNSCRFNDDDSAYLSYTPGGAGNRKTWTFSFWLKLGSLSGTEAIFSAGSAANTYTTMFVSADEIDLFSYNPASPGAFLFDKRSNFKLRDPGQWMNIVFTIDTTEISGNRLNVFINGERQLDFRGNLGRGIEPALNTDLNINSTNQHNIGLDIGGSNYFDGYMADVNFIDGQALGPEYFGAFNRDGIWVPIDPSTVISDYGLNGFRLEFGNSAALGTDTAPLTGAHVSANNFTPSGLAATDQMTDVPAFDADTGVGNALTWNGIAPGVTSAKLADGNRQVRLGGGDTNFFGNIRLPSTGKWYVELDRVGSPSGTSYMNYGISRKQHDGASSTFSDYNTQTEAYCFYGFNGQKYDPSGAGTAFDSAKQGTDRTGMIAWDGDTGSIWFGDEGTWMGSGNPSTGSTPAFTGIDPSEDWVISINTSGGGRPTEIITETSRLNYTPPTFFLPLTFSNLPEPTIKDPSDHFETLVYTGNGLTNRKVTGLNFKPDLVWIKNRDQIDEHKLMDSVRGAPSHLSSDSTAAEAEDAGGLISFDSNGLTLGTGTNGYNDDGESIVAWCWNAGDKDPAPNTTGSITSTVKTDQTAGFSIVSWTGTGAAATVGHGLGATPDMIIVKNRDAVGEWFVYHSELDSSSPENYHLVLQTTAARATGVQYWNNTAPTSTVFTASTSAAVNGSGNEIIAYCWSEIEGFSKFGSYKGNGSADGTFVYTGFRPRWVMMKSTTTAESWHMIDAVRDDNPTANYLFANATNTETGASNAVDFLSNGFKMRSTSSSTNTSGATFIFAAFAEQPFKYANAK